MEMYVPLAVLYLLLGLTAMTAQLPLFVTRVSICLTIIASTVPRSIVSGPLALHHPSLFPASIPHISRQTSASLATTSTATVSTASATQLCPLAPNATPSIISQPSKLAPFAQLESPTASDAKKTAAVVLGVSTAETNTTSLMTTPALSATPLSPTVNTARKVESVNPPALPALPPTTLPMVAAVFFAQAL